MKGKTIISVVLLALTLTGVAVAHDINRIKGTPGNDNITGTEGRDWIASYQGDDSIAALAGNDRVWAGAGNDVVEGGSGADREFGGPGNDLMHALANDHQVDFVDCGGGDHDVVWLNAAEQDTQINCEIVKTVTVTPQLSAEDDK